MVRWRMTRCMEVLMAVLMLVGSSDALLPGLYCGEQNCYSVLNTTRDVKKIELTKICRKGLATWHPDRWKGDEAKATAEEHFKLVATACETLRDEEVREEYDFLLDNPDELLRHYWYYYRRRVAPQVDVRLVIIGTVLVISIVQHLSARHKYGEAIAYLLTQPKYRLQAMEIAKERGLVAENQRKGKRKKDKEELKEEEEAIIRSIIEENIDIKGGYKKPSVKDVLVVQLVFVPYYVFDYCRWWLKWVWKFWIQREEYGREEKLHLIRKRLGLSQSMFDSLGEFELEKMLKQELWKKETFEDWKKKKEEEERRKLAENSQAKRYRRMMRNQGPGQISFVDEEF